ncbi:enoyl-CoA hydratase/isomerase family protein [Specibacter sp. RAF43]|uniref:enoyl-CoA hydratase/isomerase family protein n=1 Tax=Specibacter sp. RAF43 TaxID=3233057 RepID=UPI003F9DA430
MLHVERKNDIVWLTMDRPPANALDNQTLREIVGILEEINQDLGVRGVVVTGAGTKFFSAGGDVKEFSSITQEQGLERVRLGSRLKASLGALECPLVCAVNGAAIGSGMEMAALADFCVAADTARFGMPEINHGLLPMAKGIQQLVNVIGLKNTKDVLFSGEIFGAARGKDMGLVHEIVKPDELMNRADEWISDMASKPSELFRALKRTIVTGMHLSDEELERMTERDFLRYFGAEEATASLTSFINVSETRTAV